MLQQRRGQSNSYKSIWIKRYSIEKLLIEPSMYRINEQNNDSILEEHLGSPTVYLDHWAINDLSLNKEYKERFIKSINYFCGTLRLSVYNIVELINQSDSKQRMSILNQIYQCIPIRT